jgi:hypothetical protein
MLGRQYEVENRSSRAIGGIVGGIWTAAARISWSDLDRKLVDGE